VGSRSFIENPKVLLAFRAKGRHAMDDGAGYQLREAAAHYKAVFGAENDDIGLQNTYFWDVNNE
jgi:uncharacterized membrane protein YvbJ